MGVGLTYDPVVNLAEVGPECLETAVDFCNYAGIEENSDVSAELKRLVDATYVREYHSNGQAEADDGGAHRLVENRGH